MKLTYMIAAGLMAAMLCAVGCAKEGTVDTAPLEQSFASADSETKARVDSAVASIKGANYSAAMDELQKLANDAKLTPEQQQAIKDVLAQVQKAITDAAGEAASEAGKTVDDLLKSLPK